MGELLDTFLLRSVIKYVYALSSLLFITVLEILAIEIRQEKEIKDVPIKKEEVKLFLFAIDTTLYIKKILPNPLKKTHTLRKLSSASLQDTKSIYNNQLYLQ